MINNKFSPGLSIPRSRKNGWATMLFHRILIQFLHLRFLSTNNVPEIHATNYPLYSNPFSKNRFLLTLDISQDVLLVDVAHEIGNALPGVHLLRT